MTTIAQCRSVRRQDDCETPCSRQNIFNAINSLIVTLVNETHT
jgi:hypothetical protein